LKNALEAKGISVKYDDRDNMIEDKSYIEGANGKDTICTSTFYKYDEKGNQLEYNFVAKITNTSNFANTKQNNKYDNNNKTETTFQDCVSNSTGIVHCNSNGKDTYKYDGNNKMVEEIDYKSDGSIRGKYIYKYNSEGVQIEKNTYHADNSKTTSKYNKDGKLIEETEYNSNNIQTSTIKYFTIYDYDSNGNWIKETDSKNDIPQEITEREIIYY